MGRNQLLHALMFTPLAHGRWGLPALFIGPPGVGKTAIIEEFAATRERLRVLKQCADIIRETIPSLGAGSVAAKLLNYAEDE